MEFEYPDDGSDDTASDCARHYDCRDCEWLMDALRDLEQQRREITDTHQKEIRDCESNSPGSLADREQRFSSRMKTLERRRNSTLDVLAKHQVLEHRG
jgi:flagellar motility protein MotE (MotC chaperone)